MLATQQSKLFLLLSFFLFLFGNLQLESYNKIILLVILQDTYYYLPNTTHLVCQMLFGLCTHDLILAAAASFLFVSLRCIAGRGWLIIKSPSYIPVVCRRQIFILFFKTGENFMPTQYCVLREANDGLMELLIMSYTCKTSSCKSVIGVIPYLPYSQQSKLNLIVSITKTLLYSVI